MGMIERIDAFRIPSALNLSHEQLVIGALRGELGLALQRALSKHIGGTRRIYLYEATGSTESRLCYHHCEPAVAALFPLYDSHYRNLDPVCDAYRAAPRIGDMLIQRVRCRDVESYEYRRRFFEDSGILERVTIIQRGPLSWRAINLARDRSQGYFGDRELECAAGLACLALPLMAALDAPCGQVPRLGIDQLEKRFEARFPELPLRERQVCARAAGGLNVEATALDLDIAKSSVQTYRRRAYRRLSISSAFELSALISR